MYEFFLFLHIIGVCVGFVNLAVVSQQKSSENQKVLMMASFCSLISILSYLFEIQSTNLSEMMVGVQFGYVGKCYLLVLMLIFARNYCNIKMPSIIIRGLFLFNSFILLTILTCRYHTFYYKKVDISYDGYFPHIVTTKGIGYYMYMIVTFCLVAYYCFILISQIRTSDELEQKRLFLLLLSGILPVVMMVMYIAGFAGGLDFTPFGIILSCFLVVVNVLNLGLLDTMDVARESIINQTTEGVIVVDSNHNLLYSNSKAQRIGDKLNNAYGITDFTSWIFSKNESQFVFEIDNRQYEAKIIPLMDGDRSKGYIAWLYDHYYINNDNPEIML